MTSPGHYGSLVEDAGMVTSYKPQDGRFGNPVLRWTLLYGAIVLAASALPLWMYYVASPSLYLTIIYSGYALLSGVWILLALLAWINFLRMTTKYTSAPEASKLLRTFKHIVVVPCYTDPLPLLKENINTLLTQTRVSDLVLVITFEASTPDLSAKIAEMNAFIPADEFAKVLIISHQVNRTHEIAGGCSNKNYAVRRGAEFVAKHYDLLDTTQRYTITTCDTDTVFHPAYFEALEDTYNARNPEPKQAARFEVYQPGLFYNWNMTHRPFFVRITGTLRTLMTLGGLIGFNVNPMSVFSYPLEMSVATGFLNPRYSVDDIIAKVRWMCLTNQRVPVRLLPVPVLTGPTNGADLAEEFFEWGRQIRRWNAGASESFHFFVIHYRFQPLVSGIIWFLGFLAYYALLLCSSAPFLVSSAVMFAVLDTPTLSVLGYSVTSLHVGAAGLGIQYLVCALGMFIELRIDHNMGQWRAQDPISWPRNVFHWLTAPFVLLAYGLVSFVSVLRFAVIGKRLALHDMSAKEAL